MNRIKRLTKESAWIIVGQIISVGGALLLVRVLTEYLDPAQYGQMALALTIAGLVTQVATGGVISAIGRFYTIAAEKSDLFNYIRASVKLMGYTTLVVIAIGLILSVGLFATGQSHWLGLTAAVLVFSILSGYYSALVGIQNAARQRAVVALHGGMDALLKIFLVTGIILCVSLTSTSVVFSYALSALLVSISQLFFLRRLLSKHGDFSLTQSIQSWVNKMWLFSWPMAASGLFNWGYYASQRWALELFVSTDDVGKFYALTQIAYSPISMAGGMFMSLLTPILYARAGDGENHQRIANVRGIVFKLAALGVAATFFMAGITSFFHEDVFKILVAEQYHDMSVYMPSIVVASGLLQVSFALSIYITAQNKTKLFLLFNVVSNSIVIILNFIMTWLYGIEGLICSMIFGSLLHLLWMLRIVLKLNSTR
jgi:O-antigen/teichoic acid export membrane protein